MKNLSSIFGCYGSLFISGLSIQIPQFQQQKKTLAKRKTNLPLNFSLRELVFQSNLSVMLEMKLAKAVEPS